LVHGLNPFACSFNFTRLRLLRLPNLRLQADRQVDSPLSV
jgi:hypothetical protein